MPEPVELSSRIEHVDFNSKKKISLNEKSPDREVEAFNERLCENQDISSLILAEPAIKYNAGNAMSKNFIMLNRCEETSYLLKKHPNAFLLLTLIAERARRYEGHPDGLKVGECRIGDYKNCGLTEQKYRTAKTVLEKRSHIKIIETCRTRQKSTNGSTTEGTLVKLLTSTVYDINIEKDNDPYNDRATTGQRPGNDEQDRNNIDEIEQQQPQTPVVGFLKCIENLSLTHEEKVSLQKNPEDRVLLAIEYSKTVEIKTTLIQTLIWHCKQKNPPVNEKSIRSKICDTFKSGQIYSHIEVFYDDKCISFRHEQGNYPEVLKWNEKDFAKKFDESIEKYKLKEFWK